MPPEQLALKKLVEEQQVALIQLFFPDRSGISLSISTFELSELVEHGRCHVFSSLRVFFTLFLEVIGDLVPANQCYSNTLMNDRALDLFNTIKFILLIVLLVCLTVEISTVSKRHLNFQIRNVLRPVSFIIASHCVGPLLDTRYPACPLPKA